MTAYAGIICPVHGKQDIDKANYMSQLSEATSFWRCPVCNSDSQFDDECYEEIQLKANDFHLFALVNLVTEPGEGCDVINTRIDYVDGVDDSIKEIIEKHLKAMCIELQHLAG